MLAPAAACIDAVKHTVEVPPLFAEWDPRSFRGNPGLSKLHPDGELIRALIGVPQVRARFLGASLGITSYALL